MNRNNDEFPDFGAGARTAAMEEARDLEEGLRNPTKLQDMFQAVCNEDPTARACLDLVKLHNLGVHTQMRLMVIELVRAKQELQRSLQRKLETEPISVKVMQEIAPKAPSQQERIMQFDWVGIAREISEVNASKGFEPCTPETFLSKSMLVITELVEAESAPYDDENNSLGEELADVAIRLLSMMHEVSGGSWNNCTLHQMSRPNYFPYQGLEEALWPIVSALANGAEMYRKQGRINFGILHAALVKTIAAADQLGVDIEKEIKFKLEKNKQRPHLHGKAISA